MSRDLQFLLWTLVGAWFSLGPALIVGAAVHCYDKNWGVWLSIFTFGVTFSYLIDRRLNIEKRFEDSE